MSDVYDPAIKYGGGTENIRKVLGSISSAVASVESLERTIMTYQGKASTETIERAADKLTELHSRTFRLIRKVISDAEK